MAMASDTQTIEHFLQRHDLKKAEVMIGRRLRASLSPEERALTLLMRARVRLFRGRAEDALDDIAHAEKLHPDIAERPSTLELRADCHFARFELASVGFADRADTLQALKLYETIQRIDPEYENLGWVYYQQGRISLTENRVDEAVQRFQEALVAPTTLPKLTAYCYERLGFIAFYEQRSAKRALNLLNRAVDTYPAGEDRGWLAQVHTLRSRVLREMRQHAEALEAAQNALMISGKDNKIGMADALLSAAEILSEMEHGERDVIAYLQQFLQISRRPLGVDVTWSRVHEMLGDAYAKTGAHTAAVSAYEAALKFNPYHPWEQSLSYRAAKSCYHAGYYDRVVDMLQAMIRKAEADKDSIQDYRVYSLLGNALFALERYRDAAEAYKNAMALAPAHSETLSTLEIYLQRAVDKLGDSAK
jgi:tetratricopeptide (TPR) repeat protein